MAAAITLRELDAEVRAAMREAGLDPKRATVVLHPPLDREHARNRRRYAQVIASEAHFEFAKATLDLDDDHRRALIAHEVGHVLEHRRKGEHSEDDADRAAKRELGVPICYDRRWPGKGLQVDCRARVHNPEHRGPLTVARIDAEDGTVWLGVPFERARKHPMVPSRMYDQAELAEVPLRDLLATQPDVTERGLLKYMGAVPPCTSGTDKNCPLVLRLADGQLLIQDGHHRLTALWIRGEQTATVRLVDIGGAMRKAKKNPGGFSDAESDAVIRKVDECSKSVADNMNADATAVEYHSDGESITAKFKFTQRVPTQRHLTLVQNPKGFTAAHGELVREEFEHCFGTWAERNLLFVSYKNPRPTPKAIPIVLKVIRRPHRQADLFGNPADVVAVSKDRYRASAEEKRRYGGSTVTEFYVYYADQKNEPWAKIIGYGKTPGERKTDAIRRFKALHPREAAANPRETKDPLRKFQDAESYVLLEDMKDTSERVPWPVGSVITYVDKSGYHDSQVVVAHPTIIYHAGIRNVGVHNGYGYRLYDEAGLLTDGGSPTHIVEQKYWWPDTLKDVVTKVKRSASKNPQRQRNVAYMQPGFYYSQSFGHEENAYFLAQSQLKNGGWKGLLVRDYGRGALKPIQSTVTKADMRLWREEGSALIPRQIVNAFGQSNPSESQDDQMMMDRALVAIAYGWHRPDGSRRGYDVSPYLGRLEQIGSVQVEEQQYGGTPLVWLTEGGNEVLADIESDGELAGHLDAIQATKPRRNPGDKTPGYNSRLQIAFTTDRHGRPVAYYDGRPSQMRWFRIPYDKAKLHVAQGHADEVPFRPYGRRNPYQGDAVELAKKRKYDEERSRWEKSGRRGPPPLPPGSRARRIANRISNGGS